MIIKCRRCGSGNVRKDSLSKTGFQQICCSSCGFRSMTELKGPERDLRMKLAENLFAHSLPQPAFARTARMGRAIF